ncbi:MAG: hypothetical protein NW223_21695 [Hyphomicrobiaceae bacterium]|nr:hypothetical protein [Hyphomicrobiaceae bacterium]
MRPPRLGCASFVLGALLALAAPALAQGPRAVDARPAPAPGAREFNLGTGVPRAPFRLDEADEIATLEAIRHALSEVGDGGSYVWYRQHGRLNGLVNPTASFKDGKGRVCRHMVLIMSAGAQTGRIEGVACRDASGRWLLEG